jgi:hypothetical protein
MRRYSSARLRDDSMDGPTDACTDIFRLRRQHADASAREARERNGPLGGMTMGSYSLCAAAVAAVLVGCAPAPDASKSDSATAAHRTADSILARLDNVDGVATDTAPGTWRVDEAKSGMDDALTTVISLRDDRAFEAEPVVLALRCSGGRTELYVRTGVVKSTYDALGGTQVRYRFDDGKPVSARWKEAENHQAIFAPNSIELARQIAAAKRWRLEYRPFSAGPRVASFRTGALSAALPNVTKHCTWPSGTSDVGARSARTDGWGARAPEISDNSPMPTYPAFGKGIGQVTAEFVVDGYGYADTSTFKVITSNGAVFTRAVYEALTDMRFIPGSNGRTQAPQLMRHTFVLRPEAP